MFGHEPEKDQPAHGKKSKHHVGFWEPSVCLTWVKKFVAEILSLSFDSTQGGIWTIQTITGKSIQLIFFPVTDVSI